MNSRGGRQGVIDIPINDQLEYDHLQAAACDFFFFQMTSRLIASSLESTVKLNDGVIMPLFGLGVYQIQNNCTVFVLLLLNIRLCLRCRS